MYFFIPYQMAVHHEAELAVAGFSIKRFIPVSAEDVTRVVAASEELRVLYPNGAAVLFGRAFAEYHVGDLRNGDMLVLVHGNQYAVVQHEEKTVPSHGAGASNPPMSEAAKAELAEAPHGMPEDVAPPAEEPANGVAEKASPVAGGLAKSARKKKRDDGRRRGESVGKEKKAGKRHFSLYVAFALVLIVFLWPKNKETLENIEEHETPASVTRTHAVEPQPQESEPPPPARDTQSAGAHDPDPLVSFGLALRSNSFGTTMTLMDNMVSYFESSPHSGNKIIMGIVANQKEQLPLYRRDVARGVDSPSKAVDGITYTLLTNVVLNLGGVILADSLSDADRLEKYKHYVTLAVMSATQYELLLYLAGAIYIIERYYTGDDYILDSNEQNDPMTAHYILTRCYSWVNGFGRRAGFSESALQDVRRELLKYARFDQEKAIEAKKQREARIEAEKQAEKLRREEEAARKVEEALKNAEEIFKKEELAREEYANFIKSTINEIDGIEARIERNKVATAENLKKKREGGVSEHDFRIEERETERLLNNFISKENAKISSARDQLGSNKNSEYRRRQKVLYDLREYPELIKKLREDDPELLKKRDAYIIPF